MKPLLAAIERALPNGVERGWHYPPGARAFDAADLRNRAIADGSSPNAGREVHFGAPRTLIFLEGDDAESVFRVTDGLVMLYKLLPDGRRQVVELIGKGDVFGFSRFPVRDCSAETLMATTCLVFDRSYVERSPALAREWNARLYAQLCALHEHVMLLGRKSAMERIASFFIRWVPGRGEHGCPGPQKADDRAFIRLAMTRHEIGDYLGLTIETVSRLLGRLRRRGVGDVCQLCRLTGTQSPRAEWCSAHASERGLTSVRRAAQVTARASSPSSSVTLMSPAKAALSRFEGRPHLAPMVGVTRLVKTREAAASLQPPATASGPIRSDPN